MIFSGNLGEYRACCHKITVDFYLYYLSVYVINIKMAFFGITGLGYQNSIKSSLAPQRPVTCPASTGIVV